MKRVFRYSKKNKINSTNRWACCPVVTRNEFKKFQNTDYKIDLISTGYNFMLFSVVSQALKYFELLCMLKAKAQV